jgi:beta-lactamase regulating signal transducer with metallopeptidase domain
MKTILAALLLAAPIVYFIYESSMVIDRQMKKNMEQTAEVSVNDNIEVLTDFSLSLSSVYTYTFVIGVSLFLIGLWKLIKELKQRIKNYQYEQDPNSKAKNLKAKSEINKCFSEASFNDYKRRQEIKKRIK